LRFFFQAEDGIRDFHVTGVQTCALPIFNSVANNVTVVRGLDLISRGDHTFERALCGSGKKDPELTQSLDRYLVKSPNFSSSKPRSEERRVGKECRSRRERNHGTES